MKNIDIRFPEYGVDLMKLSATPDKDPKLPKPRVNNRFGMAVQLLGLEKERIIKNSRKH